MNPSLENFLYQTREAETAKALFSIYENALESLGFDQLAVAIISDHPKLKDGGELGIVSKN